MPSRSTMTSAARQRFDRKGAAALLIALCLALVAPPAASAQVVPGPDPTAIVDAALNLAPADPAVVIVIKNLEGLSTKLGRLNDDLGVAGQTLGDVLGEIKRAMLLGEGFADDGSLVLVMTELDRLLEDKPPVTMVLMPVVDYARFVGNYGGSSAGVTPLRLPQGHNGFAKSLGSHAVVGQTQESVSAYTPANDAAGLRSLAGPRASVLLDASDLSILINVATASDVLQAQIDKIVAAALAAPADARSPAAAGTSPDRPRSGASSGDGATQRGNMSATAIRLMGNSAKAVARDASGVLLGFEVQDQGAALTAAAQFRPGTPMASRFTNGGSGASHLARLPNRPYVYASAFDLQGVDLAAVLRDAATAFPRSGPGTGLGDIVAGIAPLAQQILGGATAFYAPSQEAMLGAGLINSVTIFQVRDTGAFLTAFQGFLNQLNSMQIETIRGTFQGIAGQPAEGEQPAPRITFNTTYLEDQMQLEGDVSVASYQINYTMPPEFTGSIGSAGSVLVMVGGAGQGGFIAAQGDYIVLTTTQDPAIIRHAMASLGAEQGLGATDVIVQTRTTALPPEAMFEYYLNMAGLTRTANVFMRMFLPDYLLEIPQNPAPVAIGTHLKGSGIGTRLFMPQPVMTYIRDASRRLQAVMAEKAAAEAGAPQ